MAYQQSPQSKDSYAICFVVVALNSTFFKSKSSKNSNIRSDKSLVDFPVFFSGIEFYSERFGDSEQDY